jgi:hypothetical protein
LSPALVIPRPGPLLDKSAAGIRDLLLRLEVIHVSGRRIGTILLRLRIQHNNQHMRRQRRAYEKIERRVLAHYGATRLLTGVHQLQIAYLTEQDLNGLMDDLLFEISGEAQLMDCFSETEAWLEGTERYW